MNEKFKGVETILAHYGENRQKHNGAIVPPIYQNTLFAFEDWDAIDRAFSDPINNSIYTRGNNPSVSMVEKKIAKLAGGEKARLFSSGMGAISSAIMSCVYSGCHIITLKNIYGPAMHLMDNYLKNKFNVEVTFVSGESVEEFRDAIKENTSLIYLESPSSAVFSMQDIEAICKLAKEHNIKTIIDNTWATPIYQKPLQMGVDLEVHSCSKYLGGHSDIISGVVIGKAELIDSIFQNELLLFGAKMAPFEAWLLMRSLRTLPMRMERHQKNAMMVAEFLEKHPKIRVVNYPGLKSFPQHELALKQMTGFSGLMSFVIDTEDVQELKNFVNSLELFSIGVSWGGHESLVHAPAISYLKEMTPEQFKATGLSLGVIRISVGLEDPNDLIADLNNALNNM